MSTHPVAQEDGSQVSETAVPAPEQRDRRRTHRTVALIPNSGSPSLPLADQFAMVEAHAQEIAMAGSSHNGLEEAPQSGPSPVVPLPPRREAGCAAETQRSFTSRAWDPDGDPSFGENMAEEITAICREEYSTHERKSAAVKRELAEL